MEGKKVTLKFKDGQELTGEIVTQALCVIILKVDNHYYIVNKFQIED